MTDILLNASGDLDFSGGDLVTGYSDKQHQEHILLANKGEYKESPELGVGIVQMLGEDDPVAILIESKKNLQYDGMIINNIRFIEDGKLTIDGYYQ